MVDSNAPGSGGWALVSALLRATWETERFPVPRAQRFRVQWERDAAK